MWSETSGRWMKREGEDTQLLTHTLLDTLTHSVSAWCGWQELAAAGSVMCHRSTLWPEHLLLCKRENNLLLPVLSLLMEGVTTKLSLRLYQDCNKYVPNSKKHWKRGRGRVAKRKRRDQYFREKLQKSRLTLPVYQCWNYSQSTKLLPSEGSFQSPRRRRGVCGECVTPLGLHCRGPGLTLQGRKRTRRTCCCCFGSHTLVWDMTDRGTALPMALNSLL